MSIYETISNLLLSNGIVNVLIAGTTCSGKTILANEIYKKFSDRYKVAIVEQDDYFKNLSDIPRSRGGYLTDSVHAFHIEEFKYDVHTLLTKGFVAMPEYDIATNKRLSKTKAKRKGTINIFEGLHTINLLSDLDNCIKIFVNTDMEICLKRRIARDTLKYKVPEKRIREYWQECVVPMCEKYIFPQKANADIVINRNEGDKYNDS